MKKHTGEVIRGRGESRRRWVETGAARVHNGGGGGEHSFWRPENLFSDSILQLWARNAQMTPAAGKSFRNKSLENGLSTLLPAVPKKLL